jgi:phosphoglycolate phosphatase
MKYRLVVFDFDGTLADTFPWLATVMNQVADRYSLGRIEEAEREILRGHDVRELMKALDIPWWKVPRIAHHVRRLMARDIHQVSLFRGVDVLLQGLSNRGIALAVVSSNSYENVRHALGPENVALIDRFECGVSVFGKAAKLMRVLSKNEVPPGESIYVGDEIRDIEAAQDVGMAFGAVSWGYNNIQALRARSPSEVFYSVHEILGKITCET